MPKGDFDEIFQILDRETKRFSAPVIDLIKIQTNDAFKVLISTILSARTKDKVTAGAVERLFSRVQVVTDLEKISRQEIERLIYPVGFYKQKAIHLKALPGALKGFSGKVPETIDELVKLPGVGRKTANLVMALGFGKPAICVDTHVHRIMNRLGYVKTRRPDETENVLREKLPKRYWIRINSMLVAYGQNVCTPVSPHCRSCELVAHCRRIGVRISR